ncbi:hypothetical protein [Streptomyces thioluteus]|uniref:hypothetical protein n=1 Tax=Streptomyces thioluteus TaxID=66431 RepID=UPI0031EF28B6
MAGGDVRAGRRVLLLRWRVAHGVRAQLPGGAGCGSDIFAGRWTGRWTSAGAAERAGR